MQQLGTQVKETVAQKIAKKQEEEKNFRAETREITLEWGKSHLQKLGEIANDPQYQSWDTIYVKVLAKKNSVLDRDKAINVVYGISRFKPSMALHCCLYSFDRQKREWKVEWVLPQSKEMAKVISKHSDGFDPLFVDSCRKYLHSNLII